MKLSSRSLSFGEFLAIALLLAAFALPSQAGCRGGCSAGRGSHPVRGFFQRVFHRTHAESAAFAATSPPATPLRAALPACGPNGCQAVSMPFAGPVVTARPPAAECEECKKVPLYLPKTK